MTGASSHVSPSFRKKVSMQYPGDKLPSGQKASLGHLMGFTSGLWGEKTCQPTYARYLFPLICVDVQYSQGSSDSLDINHSSPCPSWLGRIHCHRFDTSSDGEACACLFKTRYHLDGYPLFYHELPHWYTLLFRPCSIKLAWYQLPGRHSVQPLAADCKASVPPGHIWHWLQPEDLRERHVCDCKWINYYEFHSCHK